MMHRKFIHLLFFMLLSASSAVSQERPNSKKYRVLTYGLQDDARQNARSIIEKKWDIEFYGVSGCIINQELEDSVKKENEKVYRQIEAKYGINWYEKFDGEVEAEYKVEAYIDSLIKEQPYIKSRTIVNPNPGAPFPMQLIDKTGNYVVAVSTYNKEWKERMLYKLKVNYKKNYVEIVEDYTSG